MSDTLEVTSEVSVTDDPRVAIEKSAAEHFNQYFPDVPYTKPNLV